MKIKTLFMSQCYENVIIDSSLIIIFIIHYCQQCTATYIIDYLYSITIHVVYTSLLTFTNICTRYGMCTSAILNKKETNRLKHNYMFVKRCPVKDQ